MDLGGGVQQSYVEVPAGHCQFYIYFLYSNEMPFIVEPPDDKPKALEMEHIIFPLGLWLAGLVISVICLLAEIISKYFENQQ